MASTLSNVVSSGIGNLNGLSLGRQLALLGLLVGGVMVIVAALLWATRPSYAPLFNQIDPAEASAVMQALDARRVPYRINSRTGQIEVPERSLAETRLLLAGEGLPKSADIGFELLQEDSGFGTSRLMESARHQRALEGELGRSITALEPVEVARVHLAQPEPSVFIRERAPPKASVMVQLRGNSRLTEAQVASIVHLVASSVSNLEADNVTVVDQRGRLLTRKEDEAGGVSSNDQIDFTRRIEEIYTERVRSLLNPIFGSEQVRVQVAANLDFSRIERTEESFDPQSSVLRAEQINEEERVGSELLAMGVPGALVNQPPAGGALPGDEDEAGQPRSRRMQSTRNYEVDRIIAHVRESPGSIRRISTAVVVDYMQEITEDGETITVPRPEEQLENIRALVREAVGFDAERGDSVQVITAAFSEKADPFPGIPVWEQPWFMDLARLIAGVLVALMVLLFVVRPLINRLFEKPEEEEPEPEETLALSQEPSAIAALTGPGGPDQQAMDLEVIREMVKDDPKRVAQVMKAWLLMDGEKE